MTVATETYLFSTMVRGQGVLDFNFHPRQLDNRLPAVTGNSNAVAMITAALPDVACRGETLLGVRLLFDHQIRCDRVKDQAIT